MRPSIPPRFLRIPILAAHGIGRFIRRHWEIILLPPAVLLLAAGVTHQVLRARDGISTAAWRNHMQSAIKAARDGNQQQALATLRAAEADVPRNMQAYADMASGMESLGEQGEAFKYMERALRLAPEASQESGLVALVQGYLQEGRVADARRVLHDDVLPKWPDSVEANYCQALICLRGEGDQSAQEARKFLEAALRRDPDHLRARYQYGVCLARLGQLEDGRQALEGVLQLNPRHGSAQNELAKVLNQLGRPDEARKPLEQFQQLEAKARRQRFLETQVSLEKATSADLLQLAQIYLDLNQADRARDALIRYTVKEPVDASGHRLLAAAYERLNQPELAAASQKLAAALVRLAEQHEVPPRTEPQATGEVASTTGKE